MSAHTPLRPPYNTPHGTYPFHLISIDDILPAIKLGIAEEDEEIARITANPEPPTFDNTIVPFEKAGELLDRATTYMYNQLSAETNDRLDAVAQEADPLLSAHRSDVMLNEALFNRIKAVYEQREQRQGEERMLLERMYENFKRSGATLDAEGKERLRTITAKLSALSLQFQQNLLAATNAYVLHVTDESRLAGLPETSLAAAKQTAEEAGKEGWSFTLHAPSYVPFMSYAENRDLRREMYEAYSNRCIAGSEHDNAAIVEEIVNLRLEMARLLGYNAYADYVLERRMAHDKAAVDKLLGELLNAYKPQAEKEVEAVSQLAKSEQGADFDLMPWDFAFYSRRLKQARFDIDAEMLRPYLELSAVIKGVFGLATTLYGITFKRNADIPVYHPDVVAYEVYDIDGRFLAVLYADFHPRAGKQSGAWMTNYREEENGTERPHVAVVMNFTRPTADKPALLTLSEVETFLHEFGHALHGIFAETRFASLSGTNVLWDFVELPSQFMENYITEKDFLHTFARHYQTGEPLPDSLIERIRQSRNFNVAYGCIRQVSFGLIDMAWHTLTAPFHGDVRAFERKAREAAQLLPETSDACMTVQFSHIMSGGYSAGYYSYKWAEVLDADAFSLFKETGIFNRRTAESFRSQILSRGGTEDPALLFRRFRGRDASIDALMARDGLSRS